MDDFSLQGRIWQLRPVGSTSERKIPSKPVSFRSEWLLICLDQIFCFDVGSQIRYNLSLLITVTHAEMTKALMGDSRSLMGSLLNHMFWNRMRQSPSCGGLTFLHTFNPVGLSDGVRWCWTESITPSKQTRTANVASGREASVQGH